MQDVEHLRLFERLGKAPNSTFLHLDSSAISDVFGNDVLANTAIRVSNWTADLTPPVVVEATLNMDEGQLLLRFSELVNVSSMAPAKLGLVDASDNSRFDLAAFGFVS